MKCPKCAYQRKPIDRAPDYECPACGIIYAKYKPDSKAATEPKKIAHQSSGVFKKVMQTKAGKITVWILGGATVLFIATKIFSERFAILAVLIALAIWAVTKGIEGSRQQAQERQTAFDEKPYQHCMTCGHDFKYEKTAQRGSNTMEVALWVLLLWPIAFIYSIWRRLGAGKAKTACIVCASNQVVPATSPAAIAHKKFLGITN